MDEQAIAGAASAIYAAARTALAEFELDHEMASAVCVDVLRAAAEQYPVVAPADLRAWADRIEATA